MAQPPSGCSSQPSRHSVTSRPIVSYKDGILSGIYGLTSLASAARISLLPPVLPRPRKLSQTRSGVSWRRDLCCDVQTDLNREKSAVALLSVVSNSILMVSKLLIGMAIGSVSVISEAIHSGVDLVAACIALVAVRTSGKPADDDHPFGHGKIENISGTVEALLIFVAAIWIIVEASKKLIQRQPLEAVGWGIGVMLLSAVANMIVSHMLFKVGRKTSSPALLADAWHLRTDVYTSAGVMVGLALLWLGEKILPSRDFFWIDPLCALAVGLLIIKAAWKLTIESGRDLLDTKISDHDQAVIREILARFRPDVRSAHKLRTRRSGHTRFVQVHIQVEGSMTVEDSHQLSHRIIRAVEDRLPETSVTIHVEPSHPVTLRTSILAPGPE